MSIGKTLTVGVILVAAAGGAIYKFKPELLRQYLPKEWCDQLNVPRQVPGSYIGHLVTANDWADAESAKEKLRELIDQRLTGTEASQMKEFLQQPENRLLVADAAFAQQEIDSAPKRKELEEQRNKDLTELRQNIENNLRYLPKGVDLPEKFAVQNKKTEERIAAIEEELTYPHAVHEAASRKETAPLLEALSNNLDWANQVYNSGEETKPGEVISILEKIAKKNPNMIYNQVERDIATATALEFARSGWSQQDAVDRALFVTKSWKAGRFNKNFDKLPFWQKRIVCGLKGRGLVPGGGGNDSAGSPDSLQYSQNYVHLPEYRMPVAWQKAPYRKFNVFGENVQHGATYYTPFYDVYGKRFNELTCEVGGVCGALSHYGATSAIASGIPALTCGEPMHCSHVILVDGKWTPCYSLDWQRGMHWQVFQGNNKYSALHMATKLFSPEEKERTDTSQALRVMGKTYSAGNPEKATQFFKSAIKEQPINYYAWRDYAKHLDETAADKPEAWLELCNSLNKNLAPLYGEMSAELLKAHVYPGLKKALGNDREALKSAVLSFWDNVTTMGPDEDWDKQFGGRWNVEEMLAAQLRTLGINPQRNKEVVDVYQAVAKSLANKPAYNTVLLSWGTSLIDKMTPAVRQPFTAAVISGATSGSDVSDEEQLKKLTPIILAAETAGDLSSFHSLAKSLPKKFSHPNKPQPAPEPFPGQLVSKGGMICPSTTSRYDRPAQHWAVLEPGLGGTCHTARNNPAWVKVTLPKQANLTGIVIQIPTEKTLFSRADNLKIQVSETGADNDWHDVATLGKCKSANIRVELKDKPLAKYVRIFRPGGPEFFNVLGIYVYGTPAA